MTRVAQTSILISAGQRCSPSSHVLLCLEDSQGQTIVYGDDGFHESSLTRYNFDSLLRLLIYESERLG